MKLLILLTIFISIITINIQSNINHKMISKNIHNLQFINKTGQGITSEIASTFIKTINSAFSKYKTDVAENARQISQQLQIYYKFYYQVLILQENLTSDASFYSMQDNHYVIWKNVNILQKNWIYIIIGLSPQRYYTKNPLNGLKQTGQGINSYLQNKILQIIKQSQGKTTCTCQTSRIQPKLQNYDRNNQKWNVFCSIIQKQAGFIGNIFNYQQRFLQTSYLFIGDSRCRYLIWSIG